MIFKIGCTTHVRNTSKIHKKNIARYVIIQLLQLRYILYKLRKYAHLLALKLFEFAVWVCLSVYILGVLQSSAFRS